VSDSEWEAIAAAASAAKASRAEQLVEYQEIVALVERRLFDRDPIGLNFGTNTDEYRAEAETIVLRFCDASPVPDPGLVVHDEFVRWFGADVANRSNYDDLGRELWAMWEQWKAGRI
jgi:hypothetical protein